MDTRTLAGRLREGDRIRLIRPIAGIAPGTRGTILRRFTFDPLYDVCFDGYAKPRLVSPHDLAPARPEVSERVTGNSGT